MPSKQLNGNLFKLILLLHSRKYSQIEITLENSSYVISNKVYLYVIFFL